MMIFFVSEVPYLCTYMQLQKGAKIALVVALVAYLVSQDFRTTMIIGGAALGADMLL